MAPQTLSEIRYIASVLSPVDSATEAVWSIEDDRYPVSESARVRIEKRALAWRVLLRLFLATNVSVVIV